MKIICLNCQDSHKIKNIVLNVATTLPTKCCACGDTIENEYVHLHDEIFLDHFQSKTDPYEIDYAEQKSFFDEEEDEEEDDEVDF